MGSLDGAITTLQNQWYNAMVTQLKLDATKFQLIQASRPLGATSEEMWTIFDAIPPESVTNSVTIASHNSFFANYMAVVLTILPQGGYQFEKEMGDNMAAWEEYKKSLKPSDLKDQTIYDIFVSWADLNLNPAIAGKAKGIYKQLQNGIVPRAVDAVLDEENLLDGGPTYSPKIEQVRGDLASGRSFSVQFDSSTESSNIEHSWAKTEVGGLFKFFSGSGGGSWDKLSEKAAKSTISGSINYAHVTTVPVKPGPWYHMDALNLAYKTSDNTVWPAGQNPTWAGIFGVGTGSMQRVISEVIVADGIEGTITSSESYSSLEQQDIEASAKVGIWPFFSASAGGGNFTSASFDDKGKMTVAFSVPKGNPSIIGVNVVPISTLLGVGGEQAPDFHNLGAKFLEKI